MGALEHVELAAGPWRLLPPVNESHAAAVVAMLVDAEMARWHPAPRVVDEASAREWLLDATDWSSGEFAVWSIEDAAGAFVGNCSLWRIDVDDQRHASVAYRTAPWARRQGVATAALTAMTQWGARSLGLERFDLVHAIANPGSCRVAERAAFTLEGILRDEYRDSEGTRWDCHIHGLLSKDVR